ncbi:signaling lymphocytic activation molecule-like [Erpetoichthys calabaricus]|uniref:signaling lymphocytic activation molecule-like n=1 Tax=Erpetoichthys calabaricus TaxID=27687 RepID=UPI002233EC21|nr:signaling lymphocytic activation molecule-like [Erpetoichthys calabaricus]
MPAASDLRLLMTFKWITRRSDWIIFIIVFAEFSCASIIVTGIVGRLITLSSTPLPEVEAEIMWMKNDNTIANNAQGVISDELKDRINLTTNGWTLTIKHLKKEDGGVYKRVAFPSAGDQIPTIDIDLQVIDLPTIVFNVSKSREEGTCKIILQCNINNVTTTNYTWIKNGEIIAHGQSEQLEMSLHPGDKDINFTCLVSSPVNNATATILESCKGDFNLVIIISGIGAFIVILIIILVFYIKKKRKAQQFENKPETLYAVVNKRSAQVSEVFSFDMCSFVCS